MNLQKVIFLTFFLLALTGFLWLNDMSKMGNSISENVAIENELAQTPPMGWESWNSFAKQIDEDMIKAQVDAMIESGMKEAGYEYVIVDGGWRAPTRDSEGNMQVDQEKFPSGMKALAEYVHLKGLKFGLHQAVGMTDCGGSTPGTQSAPGGEQQDADLFAEWGIDFLKYDLCNYEFPENAPRGSAERERLTTEAFQRMGEALRRTGRSVVYSTNPLGWNVEYSGNLLDGIAHMQRTTPDIGHCWDCTPPDIRGHRRNIVQIIDAQAPLAHRAGPGGWNDADMLMVGVTTEILRQMPVPVEGYLTDIEARAHFSMWAIMASPLIASNDLLNMTESTRKILTNRKVIAINQDPKGVQGDRIRKDGDQEVWVKPLANGDRAVVLLNRGKHAVEMKTSALELGMQTSSEYQVWDLWNRKQHLSEGEISASVPPHGVAMFRIAPKI